MALSEQPVGCKICFFCDKLLPKKRYRNLFAAQRLSFKKQIETITGFSTDCTEWSRRGWSKLCCDACFAKLNRLEKIDYELETRVQKLKGEREELIADLKSVVRKEFVRPVSSSASPEMSSMITPQKGPKRGLLRTPTPKKVKRPALFLTPAKEKKLMPRPSHDHSPAPVNLTLNLLPVFAPPTMKIDKQTQAGQPLDEPGTVKVC